MLTLLMFHQEHGHHCKLSVVYVCMFHPHYCRAGVPLAEIVSEPDMRSGLDAAEYGKELQRILRYIGASDGKSSYKLDCIPSFLLLNSEQRACTM